MQDKNESTFGVSNKKLSLKLTKFQFYDVNILQPTYFENKLASTAIFPLGRGLSLIMKIQL